MQFIQTGKAGAMATRYFYRMTLTRLHIPCILSYPEIQKVMYNTTSKVDS